jgi:hypothetical protein
MVFYLRVTVPVKVVGPVRKMRSGPAGGKLGSDFLDVHDVSELAGNQIISLACLHGEFVAWEQSACGLESVVDHDVFGFAVGLEPDGGSVGQGDHFTMVYINRQICFGK